MEVLEERDLLRGDDVHHIALLIEAHTFDREQVFKVKLGQVRRLGEHVIDNLVLHALERNHTSDQGECRLVLLIQRLNLEQRAERVLLLSLVKLFVKAELVLLFEDTVGVVERLVAFCHRTRVWQIATLNSRLLAKGKLSDTASVTYPTVAMPVGRQVRVWRMVAEAPTKVLLQGVRD